MAASARMPSLKLWRMPRARYDRLVELGLFDTEDRFELLDGLLVVKERQTPRHAATAGATGALETAFGRRYHARSGAPIALDEMSEPEPDVSVVPGEPRDYRDAHPAKPALIVEVADASLAKDRGVKGSLYARARYWIVNLVDEVLEVYHQPVRAPARRHGWKYGSVRSLKRHAVVSPVAAPRARLRVADLLL
jgi:Uma2 family endonuclease